MRRRCNKAAPQGGPGSGSQTLPDAQIYGLITAVGDGIGRWGESYNKDRDKFLKFIERYDLTISDSRMAWFVPLDGTQS